MPLPGEGTTTRRLLVAAGAGLILGAAAGLIRVGGGEFRIPVLLLLLRLEVRTAAGVTLPVGLFTVSLAFTRRAGHYPWSADDLLLAGTLIGASLAGSTLGARQAHRLPSRPLLMVARFYLLAGGDLDDREGVSRGRAATDSSGWLGPDWRWRLRSASSSLR